MSTKPKPATVKASHPSPLEKGLSTLESAKFDPSPLPTPFELASLAATLMAKEGHHTKPKDAVDLAGKLWAISLEKLVQFTNDGGRTIETLRLTETFDSATAENRWHQWTYARHPEWLASEKASAAEWESWRVKARNIFKGLDWPAPFDAVACKLMGGNLEDGNSADRHNRLSSVCLAKWGPLTEKQIQEANEHRKPNLGSVLDSHQNRRKQLRDVGEDPSPWDFSDPATAPERQAAALKQLETEWKNATATELREAETRLKARASGMKTEMLDDRAAIELLILWKESEAVRKQDERTRKVRGNLKQNKAAKQKEATETRMKAHLAKTQRKSQQSPRKRTPEIQ